MKKMFKLKQVNQQLNQCKTIKPSESLPDIKQTLEPDQNIEENTTKKFSLLTAVNSTHLKEKSLHSRMKTQNQRTPERRKKEKLNTSPNRQTPVCFKTPLGEKNTNGPSYQPYRTMMTQFYTIDEAQPKVFNQKARTFSQVMPSPSKKSLLFSRMRKQSNVESIGSKSNDKHSISTSKKKISFTVYEQKSKSRMKKNVEQVLPPKTLKKEYQVPYKYDSEITIDLFKEKSQSPQKKMTRSHSKDKSSSKSLTKKQLTVKSLIKSEMCKQNDEKVLRTLQKLQRYKFVLEYIDNSEIIEKINGYVLKNEPQCKWSLLIVDQVFKKIRQEGLFENIISR